MLYRRVCLLGVLLSSIGLFVLFFILNLLYLIVFYGVFIGKIKYSMYMFFLKKKRFVGYINIVWFFWNWVIWVEIFLEIKIKNFRCEYFY